MRKRVVALVLAAVVALLLIPASSQALPTCVRVHRGLVNIVVGYCP